MLFRSYYDSSYDDIFGNTRFQLSWKESIENNYICKTDFYYPNNDKIISYIDEIKFDKSVISKTKLIYKAFFLLECIKNIDIKKCIVYLKTVKESEQFEYILKLLNICVPFYSLPLFEQLYVEVKKDCCI